MLGKLKKNLILLVYSWLIYNFGFLVVVACFLFDKEIFIYISMAGMALSGYFEFIFIQPGSGILSPSIRELTLICFFSGCVTLFFWWRKQTIIRAWLFSLSGMMTGPGLMYFALSFAIARKHEWWYGMLWLNIFYLALLIGNFLQKRFWPENRICNRIRFILKWPCIRT